MEGMEELFRLIEKKIGGHFGIPSDEEIEKTWTQVGKLTKEDQGKHRALEASTASQKRTHDMLKKKMAALKMKVEAESDEWWDYIHKTYGLPEANYHLSDDGRIFSMPKDKK